MIQCSLRAAAVALAVAAALVGGTVHAGVVVDAGGRRVEVGDTSRILAIGGDVTEILYALNAQSRIVAVDSTSQFPAGALKDKQVVGYMRALSTEGVLSTNPSIIIASKDAGPAEVVTALKGSSVPYVEVPDDFTPAGVAAKIRFIASVIDAAAAGEALAKDVEHQFALLDRQRARIAKPVRALFVLTVQNGRATVGGAHTSADAILRLAGAENAAAGVEGYKPLVDEAGMELAPEAIVTMRHSSSAFPSDRVLSVKGLKATPAGQKNRIVEMDGLYLLGFGPRSARAARDLMVALYPDLEKSPESGQ